MINTGKHPSNDIVLRGIKNEVLNEECENCIADICDRALSDACKVIFECVVRTPHVYPFHSKGAVKKDMRGVSLYQQSIIECVSSVSLIIFQERDFVDAIHMRMSPVIKSTVELTKIWLLELEKSDEKAFDLLTSSNYNFYRVMPKHEKVKFEAVLNDLSWSLHKHFMDNGFREKVRSFHRNATECFEQVMRIVFQGFERCSSVMLIRLDWGYRYKVPDLRGRFESAEDYEQRFKQVSDYRAKMLKVLRKMYGSDLVFFVWKIECASVRGLHIHWFIGLNGSKHQDRINVPRAIADKWDEVLGLGKEEAYTRNLNAHQNHETAILRVISYADPLLWRIVGGYADYLTKVDYLVRHRTPQKMHSFGSTKFANAVKKKKGPKRGKKMTKLDLSAVRRPLSVMLSKMSAKGDQ